MKQKAEPFKPHNMYKDGIAVKASTVEEHLALKKVGYGHDKPNKILLSKSFKDVVKESKTFLEAVESQL